MKKQFSIPVGKYVSKIACCLLFLFSLSSVPRVDAQVLNTDGSNVPGVPDTSGSSPLPPPVTTPLSGSCPTYTLDGPFCNGCDHPKSGSALACSGGRNQIIQGIDVSGTIGTVLVTSIDFNQETFEANSQTVALTVNLFCGAASTVHYTPNNTPIYTENFTLSGADDGKCVNLALTTPFAIGASCETLWIEFVTTGGNRCVSTPKNCNGSTATGNVSYIRAPTCSQNTPKTFRSTGFRLDATYAANFECTTGGPSISRTNPTILDPCSCTDPLNFRDAAGVTYFHDFVEVTSVTGEIWEVYAVAGAFSDEGTTPIAVGTPLVETPAGSGVYRLDLFHATGAGFTLTANRTPAGGGFYLLSDGGTCSGPCLAIPTMGEWGLIILALLVLCFATVFVMRRQTAVAGMGNISMSNSNGIPFDKTSYTKILVAVMIGLAVMFAVAVSAFGYKMTSADVPGSLIAGPVLAYLLHLVIGKK